MGIRRFITACWKAEQSSEAVTLDGIEIGDRSYRKLEGCKCDLDDLYHGEYLDTGEELSFEEILGGGSYVFLKKIDQKTCHQAYCHVLAWIKVLMDLYPKEYEAEWKTMPDDHPEDIAFAQSLDQQLQEANSLCENFLSTYQSIEQWMMKYHPEMDEQIDTCIGWSHTVIRFAKAVRDKVLESNGDIEIEFVVS